jgi:hypothetical protein
MFFPKKEGGNGDEAKKHGAASRAKPTTLFATHAFLLFFFIR